MVISMTPGLWRPFLFSSFLVKPDAGICSALWSKNSRPAETVGYSIPLIENYYQWPLHVRPFPQLPSTLLHSTLLRRPSIPTVAQFYRSSLNFHGLPIGGFHTLLKSGMTSVRNEVRVSDRSRDARESQKGIERDQGRVRAKCNGRNDN